MTRIRNFAAMISTVNDYSRLKWPLVILSVLVTLLALILLLSFQSHSWFTYEVIDKRQHTGLLVDVKLYARILEFGSFGLWEMCQSSDTDLNVGCDTYTRNTRPKIFSVIVVLTSISLFLINLSIFPTWAALILVLYNINNRYMSYLIVFLWVIFIITLAFTCLITGALILIGLSKFYSPGHYHLDANYIYFYVGPGVFYMLFATILALVCLLLIVTTIIWRQFIEMRLVEEEKDLLRQLSEENYKPGWHKVIMVPRGTSTSEDHLGEPPPYPNYSEGTMK